MTITKRIAALEAGVSSASPATRAWLGEKLTPAEHLLAEQEEAQPIPADMGGLTKEMKQWFEARLAERTE